MLSPVRAACVALVAVGCSASGLQPVQPGLQVADAADAPTPPPAVETPDTEVEDPGPPPEDPPEPPADDPPEDPPPSDQDDPPNDPPVQPPVDPPPPPPPPPPPTSTDLACFPGADLTWTTCLTTVAATGLGTDYAYPSPLNGSAQYAAPTRYLDLQAHAGSTMLAPNFRLDEIAQTYKGRYAVVQPHAIDRLQDLRNDLGALIVNSGYRPPGYNASIGGATYSRHMYGDAFDIDPVSVSLTALQSACGTHGAGYVGVYSTHMHCDWRNDPLSTAFYGAASSASFTFQPPVFDAELRSDPLAATEDGRMARVMSAPAEGWDEGEPLREWTAYDADGWALDTGVGDTWVPPEGTASVEVWIGREIVRTLEL